jgi:hypothetical protein
MDYHACQDMGGYVIEWVLVEEYDLMYAHCNNIAPFSIFISVIPIRSALLQRLGSAPPIDVFSLGSAACS